MAVYGAPLAGVDVTVVPGALATLFAAAHERLTNEPAGAHAGDGTVTAAARPPVTPAASADEALTALAGAEAPVVLAGPGVVRDGAVEALRAFAAAGSVGVLNTWGAKGVFEWRSPHHLATAGLQARDFELGGLGEADLVVATGVDPDEAIPSWRLAPVVEVAPASLGELARRWSRPARQIAVPPLRSQLARVTQEGWGDEAAPLVPSRVTLTYSEVLGADGLVAADPGVAGYWLARTFPTARLGQAVVPARPEPRGLAAACAVISRLLEPRRPVLLVLDDTADDDVTGRVLAAGEALGATVAVEVWSHEGDQLGAEGHRSRLQQLLEQGGVVRLATRPDQLAAMVDVAGPIVAWGGLPGQAGTMEAS